MRGLGRKKGKTGCLSGAAMILSACMFFVSSGYAEGAPPKGPVDTVAKALSAAFGLPENSTEITLITSGRAYAKPATGTDSSESMSREYYRFNEGAPVAEFLERPNEQPKYVEESVKEANRIAAESDKIMMQTMKTQLEYPEPPVCRNNQEDAMSSADGSRNPDVDVLFVRKALPGNPAMLVGEKTEVLIYSGDPGSIAHQKFRTFGVPCVPFRMRLSAGKVLRYFGAHALKNFDGKANARVAPEMMAYLNQELEEGEDQ